MDWSENMYDPNRTLHFHVTDTAPEAATEWLTDRAVGKVSRIPGAVGSGGYPPRAMDRLTGSLQLCSRGIGHCRGITADGDHQGCPGGRRRAFVVWRAEV